MLFIEKKRGGGKGRKGEKRGRKGGGGGGGGEARDRERGMKKRNIHILHIKSLSCFLFFC